LVNQFLDDGFKGNSVQRIVGMRKTHDSTATGMELMAEVRRLISYSFPNTFSIPFAR
jgi:hypothetical protein